MIRWYLTFLWWHSILSVNEIFHMSRWAIKLKTHVHCVINLQIDTNLQSLVQLLVIQSRWQSLHYRRQWLRQPARPWRSPTRVRWWWRGQRWRQRSHHDGGVPGCRPRRKPRGGVRGWQDPNQPNAVSDNAHTESREQMIGHAFRHVRMARAQCILYSTLINNAREDTRNAVPHSDWRYTFVIYWLWPKHRSSRYVE